MSVVYKKKAPKSGQSVKEGTKFSE